MIKLIAPSDTILEFIENNFVYIAKEDKFKKALFFIAEKLEKDYESLIKEKNIGAYSVEYKVMKEEEIYAKLDFIPKGKKDKIIIFDLNGFLKIVNIFKKKIGLEDFNVFMNEYQFDIIPYG